MIDGDGTENVELLEDEELLKRYVYYAGMHLRLPEEEHRYFVLKDEVLKRMRGE